VYRGSEKGIRDDELGTHTMELQIYIRSRHWQCQQANTPKNL
jgi:hypothetical protein